MKLLHMNKLQKIGVVFKIVIVSIKGALRVIFKRQRAYADLVIHTWAREVLHIMRVRYEIFNSNAFEFLPGRPYIIVSNHASHFDIPLIYEAFPEASIRMIAKKELFYLPIFGWGMKAGGCITIDRKNKRQALKDLAAAREAMLSGIRVWIAPEGTRSLTGELGAFKKGGFKIAADTEAVIVPVTIVGSNRILPAKTLDLSFNEKVEIYIGKPIDAANYPRKDLTKLMDDTFKEIENNLKVYIPAAKE